MILIRLILPVLLFILLHTNVYSQEKPDTSAQTAINIKTLPLTRLVFTDSLYFICGYYDASNNILYDCNGKIIDKPDKIRNKIPDSLCCSLNDTDGDGVNDVIDKCINEKGPASNYGCPVVSQSPPNVHYPAMRSIFFVSGSSYLSLESIKVLRTTVKFLKGWPDLNVNLDGHADKLGNDRLNRNLCMARIKAVRSYLLSAGIDKKRITYAVYGSEYPIDDNRTKAGRSRNRRVEFYIYKKSDK